MFDKSDHAYIEIEVTVKLDVDYTKGKRETGLNVQKS